MVKSPTAANGCYMLNGATSLSATPVSTVQPVGATSTAEAVGTAFSVLNSGVSPDDEVKYSFINLNVQSASLYSTKFKTPTKNDLQSKQFATNKISNALHISKLNTSTFLAFFKGLRMLFLHAQYGQSINLWTRV